MQTDNADKQELQRLEVAEAIKKLIIENELNEAVAKIVFAMEVQYQSGYQQAINNIRNGIRKQQNQNAQKIAANLPKGGRVQGRQERRKEGKRK